MNILWHNAFILYVDHLQKCSLRTTCLFYWKITRSMASVVKKVKLMSHHNIFLRRNSYNFKLLECYIMNIKESRMNKKFFHVILFWSFYTTDCENRWRLGLDGWILNICNFGRFSNISRFLSAKKLIKWTLINYYS